MTSKSPDAIHEVNTLVWLREASQRAGLRVTLAEVPDVEWDSLVPEGVDAVWLMGVWGRSPFGHEVALRTPGLRASWDAALPGWAENDVAGSPYSVRRYVVDPELGGPAGLAAARHALMDRGAKLIVDFVPNHVAPDHLWTTQHPEAFVRGSAEDAARDPDGFLQIGPTVFARARDPFFPPWPDVVQLDGFSEAARQLTTQTLLDIAEQADGVRCDMAMLLLDEIFAKTWAGRVGEPRTEPFWVEVLHEVQRQHPKFVLMAEAYWGRESDLLAQGFDACYDKELYDRLVGGSATDVRAHLSVDQSGQERTVRFLENHDERRAATALSLEGKERAASVVLATLPGTTLWHDGQFDGRKVQLPIFLKRRVAEAPNDALRAFLTSVVRAAPSIRLKEGTWQQRPTSGWPDNATHEALLAWTWTTDRDRTVVVVNLSDSSAQGLVDLGEIFGGRDWTFEDLLDGRTYERRAADLVKGLYVDLPAWGHHVWRSRVH
jgi:hypothetical protein